MKIIFTTLAFLLFMGNSAHATRYWVSETGGTTVGAGACTLNDGPTDPGAYMRTITDGRSCLTNPGDEVYIKSGTYNENINTNDAPIPSGTSGNTVKITVAPGNTAILNGRINILDTDWLVIDGSQKYGLIINAASITGGDSGISIGGSATNITLTNFEVKNTSADSFAGSVGAGIQTAFPANHITFSHCSSHHNGLKPGTAPPEAPYGAYIGGDFITITHCEIHSNGGYGIHQYTSFPETANNNTFSYNLVYDNDQTSGESTAGILVSSGTGNKAIGNIVRGGRSLHSGIQLGSGCVSCEVYNNVVRGIGSSGIYWIGNGTIRNNIFKDSGDTNFLKDSGATGVSGANLCHGNGGAGNCNINADPRFVSISGNDFHLCTGVSQPAGCPGASPALNAGTNLFSQGVTSDIDGNPRPPTGPFDIGAYQRSTVPSLVVNINTPNSTGSSSTTNSTTDLAGIASSNVSVTIVNWVNDRGGSGTMEGTNKWSTTGIPLQMGVNVITVTAVDSGANQVQATHTIFRSGTGPVLAMGFEEVSGTTATDSSGNNNHGTIGSGVTRTTAGKIGRALIFANQSTSHITIPNSSSLSFGNVFTVSLSAYPTQAFSDWRALLVRNYSVFFYAFSDPLGFGCSSRPLGGYVFGDGSTGYIVCDNTALTLDAWNDLALVSDGTNVTFYRDGNPVGSVPATEAITTAVGSGTLQIGASDFGENFTGMIDHVRIYNRALSQSEIQADIAAQIGVLSGITVKMGPLSKQVYGPGAKEVFGK